MPVHRLVRAADSVSVSDIIAKDLDDLSLHCLLWFPLHFLSKGLQHFIYKHDILKEKKRDILCLKAVTYDKFVSVSFPNFCSFKSLCRYAYQKVLVLQSGLWLLVQRASLPR